MLNKDDLEQQYKNFFQSGFYEEGWKLKIDSLQTKTEVDRILHLLNPPPKAHILDWCGGWGRHAIELAKRGFKVSLLDFASDHIQKAEQLLKNEQVDLEFFCVDFRETPASIQADFAINLYTAGIGCLTEEDDLNALCSLYKALKPNAKLLIDTANLFWLVRNYRPRGWTEAADKTFRILEDRSFDFWSNRNQTRFTYINSGNSDRQKEISHRYYSAAELITILRLAKFEPTQIYGDLAGSLFSFDSKRIVLVSEKM